MENINTMPKDPVCGKEIDEASARQSTGQTSFGASEVDPNMGTRSFHEGEWYYCLLYTSPSPRDRTRSRMPSSA